MTRICYDSVTAAHLPEGGDLYLAYVDGRYANVGAVRARFPGKRIVTVTVLGGNADIADCEPGDLTPQSVVSWVQRQRHAGKDPTVYCMASAWSTVRSAFRQAGEPEPHWFIASYANRSGCPLPAGFAPGIPTGAVACQYGGDLPGNYDVSTVADYWPGVDPPPTHEENLMRVPRRDHPTPIRATPQGTVVMIPGLVADASLDWENFRSVTATANATVWADAEHWDGTGAAVIYSSVPVDVVVEYV